ncbi:MAG: DUF4179 domain-containing protein [Dehalobacterium sp.]
MQEIEELLLKEKKDLHSLAVPEEMEERLKQALLHRRNQKPAKKIFLSKIAMIILALLLFGYQFDTFAFYGKKLLGYDQIMTGTLKQLNELGKGQTIDKSYRFANGTEVTLDGIMLDDNQMLAFYTFKDPKGNVNDLDMHLDMTIKGLFREYRMESGRGQTNEENTEIKNIFQFQTPFFFEKRLVLSFFLGEGNQRETGEIAFTLDRTKAMGHTLKKTLHEAMTIDGNKIRFDSLTASPTTTVITGQIQNIWELAQDEIKGERIRPNHLDLKLLANGKEISAQSGGMSTDMHGITFHYEYDALPSPLNKLQLRLVSFAADHDVQRQETLKINQAEKDLEILGQQIEINRVFEKNGETCVEITTEENVVLTQVDLIIDGVKADLEKTDSDEYDKKPDGIITHTRILHFPGSGNELILDIQRMTYQKNYHRTLDIPLE